MKIDYRKTLVAGGTIAAIVGIGGAAMAATGSSDTPAPSSSSSHAKGDHAQKGKHHKGSLLSHAAHAQIVTHNKKGSVTHTIYRGTVTAVSSSSLTVKAADGKTQAYTVTKDTKFRERAKGKKPAASTLSKIATGDRVVAAGTGTSTVTAKTVVELPKK